jgi:hypothetical protein
MAPELTIAENFPTQRRSTEAELRPRFLARAKPLTAMLFVASLFIPLIGAGLHWDPVPSSENRAMAKLPGKPKTFQQVELFTDLLLTYYRDHFGFRNTLIRGLSLAKFHGGLAVDQSTGIIIGKEGWLFFPSRARDVLADRNLDPFTPAELDGWQQMLERRYRFCAQHGIPFVIVIPPNTQTVYSEFLPESYSILGPKSRLDQLIDRLAATNSPVHIVDLRPILREAKKHRRIYFKTDTHWNDYGAYAAYPVILNAISSVLPGVKMTPQPLSDFIPETSIHSGDLGRFLNLYYEYQEDWPKLVRRIPYPQVGYSEITKGSDPHAPSLYVVHDSFTRYLYQFLGPHFSRVSWQWSLPMNGQDVLSFKPDVLLDEFVERSLYVPVPIDSPDVLAVQPR